MCDRLLNLQEIYVSGQNICIEVYGNSVGTFKVNKKAMIRNRYNRIPYPALNTPILKVGMCIFVSFPGHYLSFHHLTVICDSRNFKMFYLERNLCRKCSENENEVQFCAHQLKSVRDWFLGWGVGVLHSRD